ncbi:MAG TPA: hypothetical protein VHX17_04050 [Candidatus Cybelea sp.]|nr:hypothetical protein [Candidatus Cybelea sp.]
MRNALLALLLLAGAVPLVAASPTPAPVARPVLPKIPLHTEVVVEVNKHGQVVRVKSTKPCKVQTFNLQTFGNALQMWIRKPDGSATVGLYRVTYDYDPKTQKVARRIALISAGGTWGNDEGAANVMMDTARKQALQMEKKSQQQNAKLPSLNDIRGATPSPKPPPAATLPPL